MNVIVSLTCVPSVMVTLAEKPAGRSHPVEDAACPVKLGILRSRKRDKELTLLMSFLGTKGSTEECKPFLSPSLLSFLWGKDILALIGP